MVQYNKNEPVNIPKIINTIFTCSRNLFLVKCIIINRDFTARKEIIGDPLTDINFILNSASKFIKVEANSQSNNSLLIRTSQSDLYYNQADKQIRLTISKKESDKLLDICKKISYNEYHNIRVTEIDFAQKKLNKLYDEIKLINFS